MVSRSSSASLTACAPPQLNGEILLLQFSLFMPDFSGCRLLACLLIVCVFRSSSRVSVSPSLSVLRSSSASDASSSAGELPLAAFHFILDDLVFSQCLGTFSLYPVQTWLSGLVSVPSSFPFTQFSTYLNPFLDLLACLFVDVPAPDRHLGRTNSSPHKLSIS